MIKFCPMCGTKVITESKFCNSCGLNLVEYQKKLDKLIESDSTVQTNNANSRIPSKNIVPSKIENQPVNPKQDDNTTFNMQDYLISLDKDYGYLDNVYFNLQREKNQRKISAARKAYASSAGDENIIFVFDDTLFGAADEGFLVTDRKIYVRNSDEWGTFNIYHTEINSYSFEKDLVLNRVIGQRIVLNDENKISLTSYTEPQTKSIIALLKKIKATFCGQTTSTVSAPASTPAPKPKSSPDQLSSQETTRGVELTEEFAYYTPPPPFTPPPPKNFLGKPQIIKNFWESLK